MSTDVTSVPTGRRHVLMVDDEFQNLETFRRVYRNKFEIEIAQDGSSALDLLATRQFDVVLTDYGMPGMNGAEFVAEARNVQQVAIVMVTGYAEKSEVLALEASGSLFMVMSKPWDRKQFIDVIERASEHTRSLRSEHR
jgi:CheY-like chemotaxis protein